MSSIIDAIFAAFLFVFFGIAALIGFMVFLNISDSGILGTLATPLQGFYTAINASAIFIALAISLSAVFAGLFIRTHPVFFVVAIILVFIEFLIVPPFLEVYNSVAQSFPADVQNGMAQQSAILQMLPLLTALGTMLTVIVGLVRE